MIGLTRKLRDCEVYEIYQSAQASSILEPQPTGCWSQGTRHPKPQRSDPRIPSDQPGEESSNTLRFFSPIPDGSLGIFGLFLNTSKYTASIPSQTLFSWWSSLVLGYITPLLIGRLRCKVPSWPLPSAKEHQLGRLQHEHLQGKKCCETRNDKETINLGLVLLQLFQIVPVQIEIAVLN